MIKEMNIEKTEINLEAIKKLKIKEKTTPKTYLEAFGGWAKPKGKVNGHLIKIK